MRLTLALLALLSLGACGSGTQTCAALPGGGYCLQVASAVAPFTAEQDVLVLRAGQPPQRYIVTLETNARELRYAMLTPLGQVVLAGHADDQGAEVRGSAARRIPSAMAPALIQVALWPEAAVRAGLTSGLTLRESGNVRTLTAEDGRLMMEIRREGNALPYRSLTITLPESALEIRVTAVPDAMDDNSTQP
jgi:hypothetical protein